MSNNLHPRKWWPYVAAVGVVLFIGIIWLGARDEAATLKISPSPAASEIAVTVQAPPLNTTARVPTPFTWMVSGPVGKTATYTSVHWGTSSHPEVFGEGVSPQAAGYQNHITDYERGAYAIPRTFSGAATFALPGTYYYRAHAIIDGKNDWSPEYTIRVE